MKRICILTTTPSPYQVEYFNALSRRGFTLTVLFMGRRHRGDRVDSHEWKFEYRYLSASKKKGRRPELRWHHQLTAHLDQIGADLYILSGSYASLAFVRTFFHLRRTHKKTVLWLERPWPADYRPDWCQRLSVRYPWVYKVKQCLLRELIRRSDAVCCMGIIALNDYSSLVPAGRMFNVPYMLDESRFERVHPQKCSALRDTYNLKDKTVFLFSGRLDYRKGYDLLLESFHEVHQSNPHTALLVLGEGPLSVQGKQAGVIEAGHVSQEDLPLYYALADVFVFPSRHDGWGVVVHEACVAGCPVIVSESTGAAADLITHGYNGFTFNRDDKDALIKGMKQYLSNSELLAGHQSNMQVVAENNSIQAGCDRFESFVQSVG